MIYASDQALSLEEITALCNEQPDTPKAVIPVKDSIPRQRTCAGKKQRPVRTIPVDRLDRHVTLYDNAGVDGDSITLIYNGKILTTHQRLTDKPLTFYIKDGTRQSERTGHAPRNLGSIPPQPNTALVIINDGDTGTN